MPLVNMRTMLESAEAGKYAVGNFDVFNIEMVKGVLEAAESKRSPVILAYGEGFDDYMDISAFAPILVRAAEMASVPVVVHLDHAVNADVIFRAIHHGFTSVMVDASDKPFEGNVAMTKKIVEVSRVFGVSVEAELGHVSGLGDLYENDEYAYTDPGEAALFVKETGVDALAVAIGTVHGVYKNAPKLSIERLKEIRAAVDVPIVLHGGSGLSDDDFRSTIEHGVRKINIYTDLTIVAVDSMKRGIAAGGAPSYMDVCLKCTEAVKAEAIKKMELFGSCGKAD